MGEDVNDTDGTLLNSLDLGSQTVLWLMYSTTVVHNIQVQDEFHSNYVSILHRL